MEKGGLRSWDGWRMVSLVGVLSHPGHGTDTHPFTEPAFHNQVYNAGIARKGKEAWQDSLLIPCITGRWSLKPNRRCPFPNPINEHNNKKRRDILCPVPCNNKWCCYSGQKCIPNNDPAEPYQCDDPILQTTWLAFQKGYLSSILVDASSVISDAKSPASEYNLTIPATVTTTGTTMATEGGGAAAMTDTGPITPGSGPTRTGLSTVATTTSASNAGVRLGGNLVRGGVVTTVFAVCWGLL
ncbi:hypothetical protein V8F33_000866 [Rhypophila sp. PSN 637]